MFVGNRCHYRDGAKVWVYAGSGVVTQGGVQAGNTNNARGAAAEDVQRHWETLPPTRVWHLGTASLRIHPRLCAIRSTKSGGLASTLGQNIDCINIYSSTLLSPLRKSHQLVSLNESSISPNSPLPISLSPFCRDLLSWSNASFNVNSSL